MILRCIRNAFGKDVETDNTARFWFRNFKNKNENFKNKQRQGLI